MTDTTTRFVDPDTWWERLYEEPAAGSSSTDVGLESDDEEPWEEQPEEPEGPPEKTPRQWRVPHRRLSPHLPRLPARVQQTYSTWSSGMDPKRAARWRWVLYNGSAALAGWGLNANRPVAGALASCAQATNTVSALLLGAGMCAVTWHFADRHTRGWWPPLAWVMRIPLATVVLVLVLTPLR